jgi:hypothetical protein
MTYRLAIIDPPEADCFSFAVACIPAYGASQRQMKIMYFSVIFASQATCRVVARRAKPEAGGESFLIFAG